MTSLTQRVSSQVPSIPLSTPDAQQDAMPVGMRGERNPVPYPNNVPPTANIYRLKADDILETVNGMWAGRQAGRQAIIRQAGGRVSNAKDRSHVTLVIFWPIQLGVQAFLVAHHEDRFSARSTLLLPPEMSLSLATFPQLILQYRYTMVGNYNHMCIDPHAHGSVTLSGEFQCRRMCRRDTTAESSVTLSGSLNGASIFGFLFNDVRCSRVGTSYACPIWRALTILLK